jgi:transcriptional regulator with XRE-family HTH domain
MTRTSASKGVNRLELSEIVADRYKRKRQANPRFSVKAFANQLGLNESTLYKVMQGRRRIGVHVARQLAQKLGYELLPDPVEIPKLENLDPANAKTISQETFDVLGWIHFAILEAMKLEDFTPSENWIARRFGLSGSETARVLREMEAAGVLRRDGGQWTDTVEDAISAGPGKFSSHAMRANQKHFLEFSARQLEAIPIKKREHFLFVFPVNDKEIERLKKKSQKVLMEVADQSQKSRRPKNAIYGMQISLVPVTTLESKNGEPS